ncbi:hypothetical protein [Nocardiopsis dassonvillei]|uniref:hypothetical protein n=1 Tax=Nocardiopsis dassonvillei TaxID=2014 RepID=UPI00362B6435
MADIRFSGGIVADGPGAATADPDGMLLTPGLIDAHVHLGLPGPVRTRFGFHPPAAELAADILGLGGTIRVGTRAGMAAWRRDPLQDAVVFADPDMAVLVVEDGRIMEGEARWARYCTAACRTRSTWKPPRGRDAATASG